MLSIEGTQVPAPEVGQIWFNGDRRLRVVAVNPTPHRVVFRAGGCEVVQQVGTVLLDVLPDAGPNSVYHAYEETQWPPKADLEGGPGAPWRRPDGCPRALVHTLGLSGDGPTQQGQS